MSEKENKVDEIIAVINKLSDEEKRELTIKVRTTPEGIKAYTSFLYGVTSASREIPPKEDPKCEEETKTEDNSGSGTKDSEEWL